MYSKIEEVTYCLTPHPHAIQLPDEPSHHTRFVRGGSYKPLPIKFESNRQLRESVFVWRLSQTFLEIHEITTTSQLRSNCFCFDFALHQNNTNSVLPHIEFIEYNDNNGHGISFFLIDSNWTLYQFNVPHPIPFCLKNPELSVFDESDFDIKRFEIPIATFENEQFDPRFVSFKTLLFKDCIKLLLCSANKVSLTTINSLMNDGNDANEFVLCTNKNGGSSNYVSSFLTNYLMQSEAVNSCHYVTMQNYRILSSRMIISSVDNSGNVQLFLCSQFDSNTNKPIIHDKKSFNLIKSENNENNYCIDHCKLIFHPFTARSLKTFIIIAFYTVCDKKNDEIISYSSTLVVGCSTDNDKICIDDNSGNTALIGTPKAKCLDVQVMNRYLWCLFGNNKGRDLYFIDLEYYLLPNGPINLNKTWNFQRMWRRQEYIDRSLQNIEQSFDFKLFDKKFQKCCNLLDEYDENDRFLARKVEQLTQKIHETVLNFWLNRLLDDPTLDFDENILFKVFEEASVKYNISSNSITPFQTQWRVANISAIVNGKMEQNAIIEDDSAKKRIRFENMIRNLMTSVMDRSYESPSDSNKHNLSLSQLWEVIKSDKYLKQVWGLYNDFFQRCVFELKKKTNLIGIGLNGSPMVIKPNGFSILREMDYSEMIEIYFDCDDEHEDDVHDLNEPPVRLHQHVLKSIKHAKNNNDGRNRYQNIMQSDVYHWFIACTWFYNQNRYVLSQIDPFSNTVYDDFMCHLSEKNDEIQSNSAKQIVNLWYKHQQNYKQFYDAIAEMLLMQHDDFEMKDDTIANYKEPMAMSCIESSFSSVMMARFSLLRSVYLTILYVLFSSNEHDVESYPFCNELSNLSDLFKSYFVLSFTSSDINEKNELLFTHYLRFKKFEMQSFASYFVSPLKYACQLAKPLLLKQYEFVVFEIIIFLFCQRQYTALLKLLSYCDYTSPLFSYLIGRCDIENENNEISMILDGSNKQQSALHPHDFETIGLFQKCSEFLFALVTADEANINDYERRLLGLILSDGSFGNINNLCPEYLVKFDSDVVSFDNPYPHQFQWSVFVSYYFQLIGLYKEKLKKPQAVIDLAMEAIDFIQKHFATNKADIDGMDNDKQEIIDLVVKYTKIEQDRANKLCAIFKNDLENVLLSIYKSSFILEIVAESLKLEQYDVAYGYLVDFDDLYCAKSAIRELISSCCDNRKMDAVLKQNWRALSSNENICQQQPSDWTKNLLKMSECTITLKPFNYSRMVEEMIYDFAMRCHVSDSFCFDLLYTFSMKNCDYQFAAKYMFEYCLRVQTAFEGQESKSTHGLQFHSLCHVLSAMDLIKLDRDRYILLNFPAFPDSEYVPHPWMSAFVDDSHYKLITYEGVMKIYILMKSKGYLVNFKMKDTAHLSVEETANRLMHSQFYVQSLELLDTYDLDMTQVFVDMTQTLLRVGNEVCDDFGWDDLSELLDLYDSCETQFKYTLKVCQTIFKHNPKSPLPSFAIHFIEYKPDPQTLVSQFVKMLCSFGRIEEGIQVWKDALILCKSKNNDSNPFLRTQILLNEYCNKHKLVNGHKLLII